MSFSGIGLAHAPVVYQYEIITRVRDLNFGQTGAHYVSDLISQAITIQSSSIIFLDLFGWIESNFRRK